MEEYIKDLYDRNNSPTDEEMTECVGPASKEDDLGPSLLKEEIMTMLEKLNDEKAQGRNAEILHAGFEHNSLLLLLLRMNVIATL